MTLYAFPVIDRFPIKFSYEPISKAIIPEEKYGISYGRELYVGNKENHSVEYQDLSKVDYDLIVSFFNTVSTILPFTITFQNNTYSCIFESPIKASQKYYGYYDISFILESYNGAMNV